MSNEHLSPSITRQEDYPAEAMLRELDAEIENATIAYAANAELTAMPVIIAGLREKRTALEVLLGKLYDGVWDSEQDATAADRLLIAEAYMRESYRDQQAIYADALGITFLALYPRLPGYQGPLGAASRVSPWPPAEDTTLADEWTATGEGLPGSEGS